MVDTPKGSLAATTVLVNGFDRGRNAPIIIDMGEGVQFIPLEMNLADAQARFRTIKQ